MTPFLTSEVYAMTSYALCRCIATDSERAYFLSLTSGEVFTLPRDQDGSGLLGPMVNNVSDPVLVNGYLVREYSHGTYWIQNRFTTDSLDIILATNTAKPGHSIARPTDFFEPLGLE